MSERPTIVVLDGATVNPGDNPWDALAALGALTVHERTPAERIAERAAAAEILLTNKTPLRAGTLGSLPHLRFVSVLATGFDCVDGTAARARGVPVSNVPEYGTESVAQHVFALLLELANGVALHHAAVERGEWTAAADFSFWREAPVELSAKTFGIVGLGRIGRRVAEIARAFGLRVVAATRSAPPPSHAWIERRSVAELFAEADVVSLHCPLGAENAGFVGAALIGRMKPGAYLINTARGGLIDEAALAAALAERRIAGAAVDVVSSEPIAAGHPLLTAPNCVITPHVAWASLAARRRLVSATVENVRAFLSGGPINVVN